MTLWLALRFPHWALDSRGDGDGSRADVLVVEPQAGRRRVVAAGRQALRQGARRGMMLADARLYAPQAVVRQRRLAAEQAALERLAGRAWRYSDQVHIAAAGEAAECTRLVLEIGASRRLFGGLETLLQTIRNDLKTLGYRYRSATGDSPQAALAFARAPRRRVDQLENLPLACLALEARTRDGLRASGLRTAGELLALPPAALAKRYGMDLLDYLERLRARRPHGLGLYRLPENYRTRHEFAGTVENTQGLVFVLRRALAELEAFLRGADAAIQQLQITLSHEDTPTTCLTLKMSTPTRDAAHLERVAQDRLEQTRLAAPVHAIALASDRLRPYEHAQNTLWPDAADPGDHWPAVLDRLRARLGFEAVRWLHAPADHRPEYATAERDRPPEPVAHDNRPRPAWLLDTPQPVNDTLALIAGPERIETGWWDGAGIRRDYYRARDGRGRLLWVYRDLNEAAGPAGPVYYLHGLFA